MTIAQRSDTSPIARGVFWSVLGLSLIVAVVKRLWVIAPPGFPLGEGGLFVLFSQTILGNAFALPAEVTYGGVTIPFAYPPAAFYLAAAVAKISGADLLDVYYWLPLSLNLLAVPAFCFLAAQLTRDRIVFLCASLLYVQLPESFLWQITGGGLPRSLAAVFALLAVGLALRATTSRSRKELLLSGLCIGFAILSHLEWGMFAAIGATLAFLTRSALRKAVLLTASAGVISLLVILPWLLAVLARHGVDPFLSSSSASAWNMGASLSAAIRGRMFGILIWPAILGAVFTISRGQWLLVSWVIMAVLLTPRMGSAAGYGIPASLLAGYGFKAVGEFANRLFVTGTISFAKEARLAERP
ncbi:MAG: glycosyltransferase family 39 protein, partial [Pseudomonadota bacterium]|nr:glycosyltransferase family 39 protein [Pseudomonadota bacterium]